MQSVYLGGDVLLRRAPRRRGASKGIQKLIMKIILLLSIITSVLSLEIDLSTDSGVKWVVSNCDRTITVPATVPGVVHTDLINAGVIKENPYYRYNELEQSWVSKEKCWRYETVLNDKVFEHLSGKEDKILHLSGVDTVASFYINDQFLGQTDNAFRTYNLPIPSMIASKSSNNSVSLRIEIDSPVDYPKMQAASYPYSVPATENYNVWAEPSSRNFMRKAGCDFGW